MNIWKELCGFHVDKVPGWCMQVSKWWFAIQDYQLQFETRRYQLYLQLSRVVGLNWRGQFLDRDCSPGLHMLSLNLALSWLLTWGLRCDKPSRPAFDDPRSEWQMGARGKWVTERRQSSSIESSSYCVAIWPSQDGAAGVSTVPYQRVVENKVIFSKFFDVKFEL